jgi:hypothetical protein
MSYGSWNADIKDALAAERVFHPGQAIRWKLPASATVQTGVVERVYNDSYLLATLNDRTVVLLNTDFVEAV